MLLVFTGDRNQAHTWYGEHKDEAKFQPASLFGMVFLADIMMEGEVEAESESLGKLSSLLVKLDWIRLG